MAAQGKEKIKPRYYSISKVLASDKPTEILNDSVQLYACHFIIKVRKNSTNKQNVKITASDDLAFKLFPSYKKFYDFDFSSFLNSKGNVIIYLPIIVANTENLTYRKEENLPSMKVNKAFDLLKSAMQVQEVYSDALVLGLSTFYKLNIQKP